MFYIWLLNEKPLTLSTTLSTLVKLGLN